MSDPIYLPYIYHISLRPDARLADRTRTEDVHAAAGNQQAGLELVDENLVFPHREPHGAGDAVGVGLVVDQLDDEDTILDAGVVGRILLGADIGVDGAQA
ncbi:MAG: hypothetical protein P8Y25_15850 [Chromatiaceae bacterium]